MPSYTFVSTANAFALRGARIVFADSSESHPNIDADGIEELITPRTRAIVVVHYAGNACEMEKILALAGRYGLPVVEDAAQAHLAEYKGRKVGEFSEVTSFSFYPGKNLGAYGEAGAVVTNNEDIFNKVKKLREHGQSKKYHHDSFGHNYRMEGIQGAVLLVKLKYIEKWTNERRRVAKRYNELLGNCEQIILPTEIPDHKHVYHLYVMRGRRARPRGRHGPRPASGS